MAALIRTCEQIILAGSKISNGDADVPEFVKWFLAGEYEKILDSSHVSRFLLSNGGNPDGQTSVFCNFLKQNFDELLNQPCNNTELRDLEIEVVAAAFLQLFVQNNWLGPPTRKSPIKFCHEFFHDRLKDVEDEALDDLSLDGETVYTMSRNIIYLYIAKIILLDFRSRFAHLQTWDWWLLRCMRIHQDLLSEKSPVLKETVCQLINGISETEPLMTDNSNRDTEILFHLEAGHIFHTYFEYKTARQHFDKAVKLSGITVQLTGAMGKRTRYQAENKAQLVLQVEKDRIDNPQGYEFEKAVPKILPLDDDTVLNEIQFADGTAMTPPQLSALDEAVIMGLMESYRRSRAREKLTDEEVLTYLSFILNNASNWSVALSALTLRSKLEREDRRRVERSMMQLESLTKAFSDPTTSSEISHRIPLFYASRTPPLWNIQRELASLLLSLGCVGEALDVFQVLEMWEDVISCYQKLGKREKAESLIRERLAIKETPVLLCFLGDVTRELEHYQCAWELSGHKSARAMRCMGYIYFQEEKFDKAIECFATSVAINPLQIPVWFTYGCAAMACEKFDVGVKAFRRCVSIDYDNFEAWSNLATCYVKLQQKRKAYDTLQDAIKCSYDNWRLWENNLIIGTDCGEFEDAIRSYHRLMDLREKWSDAQVLNVLTRAVLEKIPDANGNPADFLRDKLMELFGRITSKVTTEGEIWANYAKLSSSKEPDPTKAVQYLQKAYRCFTQKADWEKDVETCKKIGDQAISLAETYSQCAQNKSQDESVKLLSGAKLMLKGALVKIQKQHTDPISQELLSEVADVCQRMDSSLSDIISQIEALRST